ncbi:MAG: chorismate pyruvate-lyase family protein [Crocosphaera sp.]|nr:chorismate pyruvate-lyase family protein [Crocosphaera sp.]
MTKLENGKHDLSSQKSKDSPVRLEEIVYVFDLNKLTDNCQNNKIMRNDLQKSLKHSHLNPSSLSTFQRILLTTNGTVTDILEAYLFEQIQLIKLSEKLIDIEHDIPNIQVKKGDKVIEREVLLRGKISRRNFIYASSVVLVDNLHERFKNELLTTKTPIGKLWFEQKVENFKEIIDSGKEPAQELANYFNVDPEENVLFRTYVVFSQKKPTMIITEKFPESYFLQNF